MSTDPTQNVGKTLTGGIQDVAALLPLLGTDQCEQHVGSALDGGYLYAAAAPLSIFGSLGIVKSGIFILISSISIPKISKFALHPFTMTFSQERWLGARTLNNAGFKPAGTVAPLIAMDGKRYKAETRLLQILDEKHIDNPENLSIEWKSRDWNISLVLFTMVAAVMSGTPYIALLLQKSKPSLTHTPWIFPLLRSVGSCLTAVCCQFLIQSRVISLMKNRIIFMVMNRVLIDGLSKHDKVDMDSRLKEYVRWDVDLPAEECLWSLKQFLSSSFTQPMEDTNKPKDHTSIAMSTLSFSNHQVISSQLQELHDEHFTTPAFDHAFMLISWVILCLSLPATVAGYIGCFTLVSNSQENGPLIWLGLEAALSIIRIAVWASNPSSDEGTYIDVNLDLTKDQPLVTTEKNDKVIKSTGTLALVPERRFLEWITPYTGPLEQFQSPENLALYFTLTTTYSRKLLYMTVFDFNKRIAVTLYREYRGFVYFDADVTCNHIASEMEAFLQSGFSKEHPWPTNDVILFDKLAKYYESILHALNRTHPYFRAPDNRDAPPITRATLRWKWSLLPKQNESDIQSREQRLEPPFKTEHDQLYLGRGSEHHLKTKLIKDWAHWIVEDMRNIRSDAQNDCHHALADEASEKAKWELTELDFQLAWEWTRRELSLILSSMKLEGILKQRMDECINKVGNEQGKGRLKEWMSSEFVIGQRNRLEKEREKMKERMEKEMKGANERTEKEGRPWGHQKEFSPQGQWEAGLKFIDEQWSTCIEGGHLALVSAVWELGRLVEEKAPRPWLLDDPDKTRLTFVKQFRQRFEHWHPQRKNERLEMDATIECIGKAHGEDLGNAYQYPYPEQTTISRFVILWNSPFQGRVSSATVYDVGYCEKDVIHDAIKKSTTRSVINMDPNLVDSIPENEHLLYVGSPSRKEPTFVQRNRERWWDQQMSNASTFYFSPQGVTYDGQFVVGRQSTIAHIFISLITQSRLRLSLLYKQSNGVSISIQENGKERRRISTEEIPGQPRQQERRLIFTEEIPEQPRWQEFELDQFEPGRHELEVVVGGDGDYWLRDILIEFFDDPPSHHSVDKDGGNLATMVENADADAEPSAIQDADVEEDTRNVNAVSPALENDVPSS